MPAAHHTSGLLAISWCHSLSLSAVTLSKAEQNLNRLKIHNSNPESTKRARLRPENELSTVPQLHCDVWASALTYCCRRMAKIYTHHCNCKWKQLSDCKLTCDYAKCKVNLAKTSSCTSLSWWWSDRISLWVQGCYIWIKHFERLNKIKTEKNCIVRSHFWLVGNIGENMPCLMTRRQK